MVYKIIRDRVRDISKEVDFGGIGEDDDYYMVKTQSADFLGYKGMHSSLIPPFTEGVRERIAREMLEKELKGVAYFNMNRIPRI
jgi:hypothetical protein